ncbi:MAG: hypothetical protein RIK87_30325 [Fuerstiella sp.]
MNYLAHGYRFLDRPLFLAGTAVPDWLSVVNRRVRVRRRLVEPVVTGTPRPDVQQIGQGILQHQADDDTFHRLPLFMQLESELTTRFRAHMPDRFDHRPAFLGHIVVELMLDAMLADADETLLDRFYHAMDQVRPEVVELAVNQMASRPTDRLAWFIQRFSEERFLYDYLDDVRMLRRINQVLTRVRLPQLPAEIRSVLSGARTIVYRHGPELLQQVEASHESS